MSNRKVLGNLDKILTKEVKPLISSNIRDLNRGKIASKVVKVNGKRVLVSAEVIGDIVPVNYFAEDRDGNDCGPGYGLRSFETTFKVKSPYAGGNINEDFEEWMTKIDECLTYTFMIEETPNQRVYKLVCDDSANSAYWPDSYAFDRIEVNGQAMPAAQALLYGPVLAIKKMFPGVVFSNFSTIVVEGGTGKDLAELSIRNNNVYFKKLDDHTIDYDDDDGDF